MRGGEEVARHIDEVMRHLLHEEHGRSHGPRMTLRMTLAVRVHSGYHLVLTWCGASDPGNGRRAVRRRRGAAARMSTSAPSRRCAADQRLMRTGGDADKGIGIRVIWRDNGASRLHGHAEQAAVIWKSTLPSW